MKRMFMLLFTCIFCIGMAACGQEPADPADSSTDNEQTAVSLLNQPWDKIVEQAKAEGSLSLWVWSDEDLWRQIAGDFEAQYGIPVSIMISDKNTVLNKVLSEKDGKKGSIDVMGLPGDIINTMMEADVLYGKILDVMPNKDLLDPILSDCNEGVKSNHTWVPVWRGYTAMLYNPAMVDESALPQTWEQLEQWIDENPKKLAFCLPEKGGSGQSFMQAVITNTTGGIEQYMEDTAVDESKTAQWGTVWDWINSRKDKLLFTNSNSDSLTRINQGEAAMTVAWDSNASSTIAAGELLSEVKLYIPEFGLASGGDVQTVLKNAPHPAAGLLWLDFMTTDKGQQTVMDRLHNYSVRTDLHFDGTLLSSDDLKNAVEWLPAVYKSYYIDEFTKNVLMN